MPKHALHSHSLALKTRVTLLPCVLSPRRLVRFGQIELSTSSWARRQGGWQQQGEVRDLVSPRTRPHPSHIPSSPPPLTTLTPVCHVRRSRRRAALCATLVVKELYYIRPMAQGQFIDASGTHSRPFCARVFVDCGCSVVRSKFQTRVYCRIGANPHVCASLMIV